MKVLMDGFDRFAGEVFHFQAGFHGFEVLFDAPAEMIKVLEQGTRIEGGIQKGGEEKGVLGAGERDPQQAYANRGERESIGVALVSGGSGGMKGDPLFLFSRAGKPLDHAPGIRGDPSAKMRGSGKHPNEEPEGGIPAIEENQILTSQRRPMRQSQFAFIYAVGSEHGIQGEMVEQVIELRGARHQPVDGRGIRLGVEMSRRGGIRGDLQGGLIDRQESKPLPRFQRGMCFHESHEVVVEFEEGAMTEFVARLAEGTFGDLA